MALIRWEPARELHSIQQEMNRLLGTVFDSSTGTVAAGNSRRRWTPAMDLHEQDDQFVLEADLPGVSEQDVTIELDDNVLTISGERSSEQEDRKDGYYRLERASGSFSRSLSLPDGVEAENIQASFQNGVLEVRIPKPVQRKPHRVAISVVDKEAATAQETGSGSTQ